MVFVCDDLRGRVIKLAYALKVAGWDVTLLHKQNISFDVSGYFRETRQFDSDWDALLCAAHQRPVAVHVFSVYDFHAASMFIRHKPAAIVFDNYDVLTGMAKPNVLERYPGQAELEQYCYRNADGLCCRDLRVQHLRKTLRHAFRATLFFPEYCWPKDHFPTMPKLTDGIHVVHVGSIDPDPESTGSFVYELAALLSRNKVHLHIYPLHAQVIPHLKANMSRFVAPEVLESHVHLHDRLSPLDIRQEISKYHYGVLLSTRHVDLGDDHNAYFRHAGDYVLTSKLFDYLDAGLFPLTQDGGVTRFILRRCHGGKVVRSLEDIVRECEQEPAQSPVIPESLRLESNASRLTRFYSKLDRERQRGGSS